MNAFIKNYWKVGLCFLGIFLAGAITGGVVTAGVIKRAIVKRANPDNWQEMSMRALTRKLNLRPDQVEKIRPIVANGVQDLRVTRQTRMAEVSQTLEQCRINISAVLDPAQQKQFEKLIAERQERWKEIIQGK